MISSRGRLVLSLGVLVLLAGGVWAADADKLRLDAYGDPLPAEALQRLGSPCFRAETNNYNAALSPDGSTIAVLGRNGIVVLDASSGKEVRRFVQRFFVSLGTLLYSPDGKKLAWSSIQGVQLFDVKSGKLLGQIREGSESLSFSADGSRLALGHDPGNRKLTASIWDTTTFKKLQTVEMMQDLHIGEGVALSGEGKRLATWSRCIDGAANKAARTVQIWDAATGKEIQKIALDGVEVTTAVLSPDGKHLAAIADPDTAITVWDVDSGKKLHTLEARKAGPLLRYSPDGKRLVSATTDGALQLWETPAYKRLDRVSGPKAYVCAVAFLPDNKVRALSRSGQALRIWDAPSDRRLVEVDGHHDAVQSLGFRRDGKEILSAAADGVRVWDVETGKTKRRPDLHGTDSAAGVFGPICLAPNGRRAAVGSYYGQSWRVVDLDNDKELIHLESKWNDFPNPSAAFSADGNTVILALATAKDGHRGFAVRTWDLRTVREKSVLNLRPGDENATGVWFVCAVSPDGQSVLTAMNMPPRKGTLTSYVELALWDVATGKARWKVNREDQSAHWLAFSPDRTWIATAGLVTSTVYLLDAATGMERRRLESVEGIQAGCLQFSPDSRSLAVGGYRRPKDREMDGSVRVWETATGKPRLTFAGHHMDVRALAFSPDGRTLASGSADTTILVWDLTGKLNAAVQKQEKPKPAEFDALWDKLANADAEKAYRLLQRLAAHPAEAVALVKAKLRPAKGNAVDAAEIEKRIADLDHEDFDRREAASKALAALGKAASAALLKALGAEPSVEKKRRIDELLAALKDLAPEMRRQIRALEVLERIGTPEAKQVLEELAKGDADAPLTQEAKATLKRLAAR